MPSSAENNTGHLFDNADKLKGIEKNAKALESIKAQVHGHVERLADSLRRTAR